MEILIILSIIILTILCCLAVIMNDWVYCTLISLVLFIFGVINYVLMTEPKQTFESNKKVTCKIKQINFVNGKKDTVYVYTLK